MAVKKLLNTSLWKTSTAKLAPDLCLEETKWIYLKTKEVRMLDSSKYLTMSLANVAKAFKVETKKGNFSAETCRRGKENDNSYEMERQQLRKCEQRAEESVNEFCTRKRQIFSKASTNRLTIYRRKPLSRRRREPRGWRIQPGGVSYYALCRVTGSTRLDEMDQIHWTTTGRLRRERHLLKADLREAKSVVELARNQQPPVFDSRWEIELLAGRHQQEMRRLLELDTVHSCEICLEPYEANKTLHGPHVMGCGHTICREVWTASSTALRAGIPSRTRTVRQKSPPTSTSSPHFINNFLLNSE